MPLVIPNVGALRLLPLTLGKASNSSLAWEVVLFVNNYTPVPGSVYADFTPASFTGGSPVAIDQTLWDSPTVISDRASSEYDGGTPIVWTNGSSAQTAYGYLVYDTVDNTVLWAERFGTERIVNPGSDLELFLNFTGGTQL